ncbi:MAG: exodeoxyribonuclease-5 [Sphingobacteriales bacterium]|jgi:exodeoxyribonuclease-5
MNEVAVLDQFTKGLGFELTEGQKRFVRYASALMNSPKDHCCLILSGYAGTGKTSMVSQFIKIISAWDYTPVLLAPTGRAAKVFERMSGLSASTIHRYIYTFSEEDDDFRFEVRKNSTKKAVYFIDEASMIGDHSDGIGKGNLMEDVFQFIFQQKQSKIILVGDEGQLPPVGLDYSPVLDLENLQSYFSVPIAKVRLTEVVRQSLESGVLKNATHIRSNALLQLEVCPDFEAITGVEFPELLESSYGKHTTENVLVVCRSNKMAYKYNMAIRNRIFDYEEALCSNDLLMAVKNNYFWLKKHKRKGFIANGESLKVQRILGYHSLGPFQFADVEAQVGIEEEPISLTLWIDTLTSDGANMPRKETQKLYNLVKLDLINQKGDFTKKELKNNGILNAIQVKYAYAVTCHKAQGGQWKEVYIDCGYYQEEEPDLEYRRWLYTAVTRAEEKVHLIQAPSRFFPNEIY